METVWGENSLYYSQRNNLRSYINVCGNTSLINDLVSLGHKIPEGDGQKEDCLFDFEYASPECKALYETLDPKHQYNLHEWQAVIALAVNLWLNKDVARFDGCARESSILAHVSEKGCCVVTGAFPGPGKIFRHSVGLVGVSWNDTGATGWKLKDPWGNHLTLYRDQCGNLIPFTPEEFRRILFTENHDSKWCIYVDKP